jgi:hypothetical protein
MTKTHDNTTTRQHDNTTTRQHDNGNSERIPSANKKRDTSSRVVRSTLTSLAMLAGMLVPNTASASWFSTEWMRTWDGCECYGGPNLTYTDNQANLFGWKMMSYNNSWWGNYSYHSVWASDLAEMSDPAITGQDDIYGDMTDLWFYSGHGYSQHSNPNGGQIFKAPACHKGTLSTNDQCYYRSERSRFGERFGPYATPNQGSLRWLIMATCFSVDTSPFWQWYKALTYGGDAVYGFRGLSTDSPFTDEIGESFAIDAFGDQDPMTASWFSANDDFWINDTSAVIVTDGDFTGWHAGLSGALGRLEHMRTWWWRRPWNFQATAFAWNYHEG